MHEFDLARICKIKKDIDKFFKALKDRRVDSINDLKNEEKFYAVSMILLTIINRAIDLGDEIVSSLSIGMPLVYRDIFFFLRSNNYISVELFNKMNTLVHDRNLLSHEYHDFDEQDVFNIFQRIGAVNDFVKRVKEIITTKQEEV